MAKQQASIEEPTIEDGGKVEPRPVALPPEGRKFFHVSWKGKPEPQRVTAADENEAWALYCDGNQVWPPPASRVIVEVDGKGIPVKPDTMLTKGEAAKAQSEVNFITAKVEAELKAAELEKTLKAATEAAKAEAAKNAPAK